MKKFITPLILILLSFSVYGQNISGVVNVYSPVTAINLNTISVLNASSFAVGDRVLIIKMKGATIDQTNTASYGDSVNMNDAGYYVFTDIVGISGNDVTVDTFCNIFDSLAYIQMVSVPIYANPNIIGTLSCDPWNGSVGGVLIFEATGTLTFQSDINVSENGYRGGAISSPNTFNCGNVNYFNPLSPDGRKGEGAADFILGQECGRGKLINGGGSAFAGNAGAGGGANGGAGGRGGNQYSGCSPVAKWGVGAIPINHQNQAFFMGGGGGGPQADNGQTVFPGGNGGAIVYIKANQIDGAGFAIYSSGGDVATCNDEGSGAGGAGGSIYLDCNNYTGALNIYAQGGEGGSNNNTLFATNCHGPGGGGGGGLVWFSTAATPVGVNTNLNGGLAGLILNPSSTCANTSYNATDGATGIVDFLFTPLNSQNPPNVDLGPDLPICIGETISLSAPTGFPQYLWDDMSTMSTRDVTAPGTYYVTVVNTLGCIGTDTINVVLDTSVQANFTTQIDLGCFQDTVNFTNTSVGASVYLWDFGDGSAVSGQTNPTHIYQTQGTYTIQLIAGSPPCFDTTTQTITINHTVEAIFTISPDSVCLGDVVVASSVSLPTFPLGIHNWSWGDGTSTPFNPVPSHTYTSGGTYIIKLVVTDLIGCSDSMELPVYVEEPGFASFGVSDDEVCLGEPIYFFDSVSANTIRYSWDFGQGTIIFNKHNPTFTYDIPGSYTAIFNAEYQVCPDISLDTLITVNGYPEIDLGPDQGICPDVSPGITLQNTINSSATYEWSTGEVSNSITVTEPDRYWVRADNGTCSSSDSIWIKRDCYINIPNAFSPNGDGLNDYFFPRDLLSSGVTSLNLKIFNRWGELIFQTDNVEGRGWDGKYGGELQPMGAYVYLIDVVFKNGALGNWTGNVTLVR